MRLRPIVILTVICVMAIVFVWHRMGNQGALNPQPPGLSIARNVLQNEDQDFAVVTGPRKFEFPEDHGPHFEYRSEWWYFTGNLVAGNGDEFGYQFTVFRQANRASDKLTKSEWEASQIYMAHLALTDRREYAFYSDERFARGALGFGRVSATPFSAQVDRWSATGRENTACQGCLDLHIEANGEGYSIDLNLESIKPVVYQGNRGFSQKGSEAGNASHYYSLTRLKTDGVVSIGNESISVSGLSWMDHEWSTSALGNELAGWDWVSLQFTDGRDLMYYQLRTKQGDAFRTSEGTLIDQSGASERLTRDSVIFEPTRHWVSDRTGIRYPIAWSLEIPERNLSLQIEPLMDAQEHDSLFRYWEGAVRVTGQDSAGQIDGVGYLELVGYE